MSSAALTGRTALVTGGGVGIGAAIAEALAEAGARVAITYRTHTPEESWLARIAEVSGAEPLALRVEAASEPEVRDAVDRTVETCGGIDILVNNVGSMVRRATLDALDLATWRAILEVNLDTMYLFTHHAAPHLPTGSHGRIINVASLAGHTGGGPGALAYATAKAGMFGFTRGLAAELGPRQITVNALAPGFIGATPFHETFTAPEARQRAVGAIPLGRAGDPADVADAARWLASDGAGFVTGAVIDVNGGQYFH
ncbi:SDR family NAD(P)-dependent oxidoreductase [Georgenia alba]|uniref:SDR family NAD(P)-dependent oxidoreductase n=1 Tax=Georgenia alba TaxID=2233858 RepID=A0ABW2Q3G0_9MICO